MVTARVATTTERLAALSERLQQLDSRLKRLEVGEGSSDEDLRKALGNARRQRARALEAEAALGRVRRRVNRAPAARAGAGVPRTGDDLKTSPDAAVAPADRSSSSALYWRAIMDECRRRGWHDWSGAWCQVAGAALPSVRGAAISVVTDGLLTSLATTDGWTHRLEESQRVLGEGPASATQTTGGPVMARLDDPADQTWLAWTRLALSRGAREVWSFPRSLPGLDRVTVTFYRNRIGANGSEWTEASVLAGLAARALIADARRAGAPEMIPPDPVDVAIGVLTERMHLSPADAFALMRARAFVADHGLFEVATAVLDGGFDPD